MARYAVVPFNGRDFEIQDAELGRAVARVFGGWVDGPSVMDAPVEIDPLATAELLAGALDRDHAAGPTAATKLARAAHRLGLEAHAWERLAGELSIEPGVEAAALTTWAMQARARAADLERFVREEELGAPASPSIVLPVALAGRLLDAIDPLRCCADARPADCVCPRGVLRKTLRAEIAQARGELLADASPESELERARR